MAAFRALTIWSIVGPAAGPGVGPAGGALSVAARDEYPAASAAAAAIVRIGILFMPHLLPGR
jgi:hypothetical protein